jgi:hypothetical protein
MTQFRADHIRPSARRVAALQMLVHCENQERGCVRPLQQKSLSAHVCDFAPVHCPYPGCKFTYGATSKLNRQDLDPHKQQCEWRRLPCSFACGAIFPAKLQSTHESHCIRRLIDCPNGCSEHVPLEGTQAHLSESCPNTVIKCDVDGCEFTARRGAAVLWDRHFEDAQVVHSRFVLIGVKAKNEEIEKLRKVRISPPYFF